MNASEIWKRDDERIKSFKDVGYEVEVIWENTNKQFKHSTKQFIFICMVKLAKLLCEGLKLNPLTTIQQLRHTKTITCYHASESGGFEPLDKPLHVGSLQQSLSLVKNMNADHPYYIYQLNVNLGHISPFIFPEDPQIENNSQTRFNSIAYENRIEFPEGLHRGSNISIVIINPKEQIISKKLIHISK